MRAYSLKAQQQKLHHESEKYILQNYEQVMYEAVAHEAPYLSRQMVAMMLYAMSQHGYGTKRLNDFYQWFLDVMNMPEVFGKRIDCDNAIDMLAEKHNIDFTRLNIRFETWEEYAKRNGIRNK